MTVKCLIALCVIVIICRIAKTTDPSKEKGKQKIAEYSECTECHFEKDSPECSSSTQDGSHLEKSQEIKKLWEKFSQMTYIDITQDLLDHQFKIIEWIKLIGNGKLKRVELSKPLFDDLMEFLNLSPEELRKLNEPICSTSTQDSPLSEKSQAMEKLWLKLSQITYLDLSIDLADYKDKIIEWVKRKTGNDKTKTIEMSKPVFDDLMEFLNLSLEELRELTKPILCFPQDLPISEKQQEMLKLWDKFSQMNYLDLTYDLRDHKDKITEWIKRKTGNDKSKIFGLSKPVFDDLMEFLNLSLEELRELNKPMLCFIQDLPLSEKSQDKLWLNTPPSEKSIEINKIWQKSLELDGLDLLKELPDHHDEIYEWINEHIGLNNEVETFLFPVERLKDLLESLNLSLEELRDLYERIGKNSCDIPPYQQLLNLGLEEQRELNKPMLCYTSTQDPPLSEKSIEINKIWQKSLELDGLDLLKELPDHHDEIFEWVDEHIGLNNEVETFEFPQERLKDILEDLNLSLEELRDLYERLGENSHKKPLYQQLLNLRLNFI